MTIREVLRSAGRAWLRLGGGLGTACYALVVLLVALVTAPVAPTAGLRLVHRVADRERLRLSRRGPEVLTPGPPPPGLRQALTTPAVRRELSWLVRHATGGLLTGLAGVLLPVYALRDGTFPLWWRALPPGEATSGIGFFSVHDWPGALGIGLLGVCWLAAFLGLSPHLARLQAAPGRRLLAPAPGTDLALRVAELTATRAAALDAHAAELRRIERSLHDGTQNRLVATTVLLGAARRMLTRDPAAADELLERAQAATEQALAELRAVARGILPPILADRGLADALAGLAAGCPVPCRVAVDLPGRCAASVEATAYFVVAEALTNVARHSGATRAEITGGVTAGRLRLRITDDGRGGAVPALPVGGGSLPAGPAGNGPGSAGNGPGPAGNGPGPAGNGPGPAGNGPGSAGNGPGPAGPAGSAGGGSGLAGMRGRVEAHDGTLAVSSPPGGPTTVEMELPCGS